MTTDDPLPNAGATTVATAGGVAADERNSLSVAWIETPVGILRAGASDSALHLLQFTNITRAPDSRSSPILERTRQQLSEYFAGHRREFDIPLRLKGNAFEASVWRSLLGIRYGERISYLDQSRRIGDEKAIRAVAQANGRNPIVILVPCHRVINADGQLGGFGGGLLRKQFLLDLERGDRLL